MIRKLNGVGEERSGSADYEFGLGLGLIELVERSLSRAGARRGRGANVVLLEGNLKGNRFRGAVSSAETAHIRV